MRRVARGAVRCQGMQGWQRRACAVPTVFIRREVVGSRSLSSGARSRDPLAQPTLRTIPHQRRPNKFRIFRIFP
jgi:hypothetical protein